MRYEDVRRSRGRDGVWLRLRQAIWVACARRNTGRLDGLSDHQLKDIGLLGFERPADWWRFR
jgi:hypothetical protein